MRDPGLLSFRGGLILRAELGINLVVATRQVVSPNGQVTTRTRIAYLPARSTVGPRGGRVTGRVVIVAIQGLPGADDGRRFLSTPRTR